MIVKQGGIKYHFLSFWYELTWDWTTGEWLSGSVFANGPGAWYSILGRHAKDFENGNWYLFA